jgi:site-specific recombinase XerD
MLTVMYRAGLRHSEVLDLEPKDLDRKAGAIRVMHGKGNKSRTVGMDRDGFKAVAEWARIRNPEAVKLFHSASGARLCSTYLRQILPGLARKARIQKRVHAHGLRHTLAAELREENEDIGIISKQLGHSNIGTTARYLDHVAPTRVIEAVSSRKWRKK